MREGESSGPGKVHIQTPGKQGAFGLVEPGASIPSCAQETNRSGHQDVHAPGGETPAIRPGRAERDRVPHNQREIHFQGRRLVVIAPEINKSTNGSIFNKLHTEGECNFHRLIEQGRQPCPEISGSSGATLLQPDSCSLE
ncbi:hypothetical protein AV530_020116 [Patagioenas fasciata monilis]|uniref:Uncharacterized protein n=1 Tax=Patagioenas fasciata monilis TaxID=372326 RepID=A0A1V4JI32_PATFA|nr:hypothetical protein AV530_020116 [Patagioenas fasciata monilis]